MPLLDQAQLDDIVETTGQNPTQRAAIRKALTRVDAILTESRTDPAPMSEGRPAPKLVAPRGDVLIFVLSGERTSDQDSAELRRGLVAAQEKFGKVHVVTAGRMGVERDALAWARRNDQPLSEIAAMWATPNGDGTTSRNPNARNPRNAKLRMLAEVAVEANLPTYVWCWGVERGNDAIEPLLVKAGCKARRSSKHYVEEITDASGTQ